MLAAVVVTFLATESRPDTAAAKHRGTVVERIQYLRKQTWRWQRLMEKPKTPAPRRAERVQDSNYRAYVLDYWRRKAAKARRQAMRPPHRYAWLCIHRYEGSWRANTGNGYYGGLQMDITFQRMYGRDLLRRKGLAHNWKPIEQIWVAERAYRRGRGFYPWPNAARRCGLI